MKADISYKIFLDYKNSEAIAKEIKDKLDAYLNGLLDSARSSDVITHTTVSSCLGIYH